MAEIVPQTFLVFDGVLVRNLVAWSMTVNDSETSRSQEGEAHRKLKKPSGNPKSMLPAFTHLEQCLKNLLRRKYINP